MTRRNKHIVNIYSYTPDSTLNSLKFNEMTDGWLEFVVNCRRGIEHEYDIVEGPMADDTIWDYHRKLYRWNNQQGSLLGTGKI